MFDLHLINIENLTFFLNLLYYTLCNMKFYKVIKNKYTYRLYAIHTMFYLSQ